MRQTGDARSHVQYRVSWPARLHARASALPQPTSNHYGTCSVEPGESRRNSPTYPMGRGHLWRCLPWISYRRLFYCIRWVALNKRNMSRPTILTQLSSSWAYNPMIVSLRCTSAPDWQASPTAVGGDSCQILVAKISADLLITPQTAYFYQHIKSRNKNQHS